MCKPYFHNKHETTPREEKSNVRLMQDYAATLITNMLNARLNELLQAANPLHIYAATYDDDFVAKTKDAFTGIIVCKEDAIENGISTVLREIERARQFGFTETEYNVPAEYLRHLESAFQERDKNESYVKEYVRHFLDNELYSALPTNIPYQPDSTGYLCNCPKPDDAANGDRQQTVW